VPATSSSPTALADAATAAGVPARPLSTRESISLLEALAAVPDPRQRRGRRYSLQSVLLLALSAILAGARSYAAIADWAAVAEQQVRVCADPPHASTFRRLLSRLDPVALQAALTGWVLTRRDAAAQGGAAGDPGAERRHVLAADGKTLRGTRTPDGVQVKVFGVYEHASHLVLTQTTVADGDEIAAFTAALATLPDLQGVVVTADALHCQREHATWLHARGGHYLFTVKANQPTLRRALAALPWAQVPGSRRRQAGHGRAESRSVKVIDLDGSPGRGAVSTRRSGDQGRPTAPGQPHRQDLDRDHLRGHLADLPPGRPGAARGLDPGSLGHREPGTPRPRRDSGWMPAASAPAPGPRSWPFCATPRLTCTDSTGTATSPAPNAGPAGEPAALKPPSPQRDQRHPSWSTRLFQTMPRPCSWWRFTASIAFTATPNLLATSSGLSSARTVQFVAAT
jgi:hypothetical protein